MQLKFNIELNSRPDKSNRSSVMVRLHLKGHKPGRVLTSVKIEKAARNWNPDAEWGKWVIRHLDKDKLNDDIKAEFNRIVAQVKKWQEVEPDSILTPQQLAERFRTGTTDKYFEWLDKVLDEAKDQAYATYVAKRSVVNMLKAWAGPDLLLASVSPTLVREFQQHLRKSEKEHGGKRSASTVNKYMDRLHVLHQEVLIKTGVSPKQAEYLSPWTEAVALEEVKSRRVKLAPVEVEKLSTVQLETTRRKVTPEGAFRIWMLARLLAGMRFGDVLSLRYRNFTLNEAGEPISLRYEMLKTGNWVNLPIFEEGRELLKPYWNAAAQPTDYVLPYLYTDRSYGYILTHEQYRKAPFEVKKRLYNDITHWNRQFNTCLKQLETEAGLTEKLRTHNSRHSFGELARQIMQRDKTITIYDIQLLFGHSSYKTTELYYADGEHQDSAPAMQAIFGKAK